MTCGSTQIPQGGGEYPGLLFGEVLAAVAFTAPKVCLFLSFLSDPFFLHSPCSLSLSLFPSPDPPLYSGVPTSSVTPAKTEGGVLWVDKKSNVWEYSGYGIPGNMFLYNTSINMWAWMAGSKCPHISCAPSRFSLSRLAFSLMPFSFLLLLAFSFSFLLLLSLICALSWPFWQRVRACGLSWIWSSHSRT